MAVGRHGPLFLGVVRAATEEKKQRYLESGLVVVVLRAGPLVVVFLEAHPTFAAAAAAAAVT